MIATVMMMTPREKTMPRPIFFFLSSWRDGRTAIGRAMIIRSLAMSTVVEKMMLKVCRQFSLSESQAPTNIY